MKQNLPMLALPRLVKKILAIGLDMSLVVITVALAYWLRLEHLIMPTGYQWLPYLVGVILALPLFVAFNFYQFIFRYLGWQALMTLARAFAIYGSLYAIIFTAIGFTGVPRAIGVIQPILLFMVISISRAVARYWLGGGSRRLLPLKKHRRSVLIYGAGSSGRQLAAGLASSDDMSVVFFVDDDPKLHGQLLNGIRILPSEEISAIIAKHRIADVLLAIPSVQRSRRIKIIESLRGTSATVRTLPGLMDLAHGRITVNDLHELDVEDLLARDAVAPAPDLLHKCVTDKVVLLSGAGGSIGSELCRQILALKPAAIVLVEQSELNLYNIHQELENKLLAQDGTSTTVVPLLASVQDETRMRSILAEWKPATIYHAAAYKHVPLLEANPAQGIRNNILGTRMIAKLALEYGVADFVLISSDKAVRPTNVMGATKRLAEQILQALAAEGGATRFSMVRFGNVLGSSGSVVPLFRRQIQAGGPITITHRDITRYFMTIPEAAALVIQAGAMAEGGEVFVLDMGEPVKIYDLARQMIQLSGLVVADEQNPDGDIAISVIGLRPGEKLYEELLIGNNPKATKHPRIMMANEEYPAWALLQTNLQMIDTVVDDLDPRAIRKLLQELVPEFVPAA